MLVWSFIVPIRDVKPATKSIKRTTMSDNHLSAEALNGLNATLRRLVYAYEFINGIELGPRGYFKLNDNSNNSTTLNAIQNVPN